MSDGFHELELLWQHGVLIRRLFQHLSGMVTLRLVETFVTACFTLEFEILVVRNRNIFSLYAPLHVALLLMNKFVRNVRKPRLPN